MKTTFLFVALIFTCIFPKAQTYLDFPDSAAIWVNEYHYDEPGWGKEYWKVRYCMESGDTTMMGHTYSRVDRCLGNYKGAIRSDSGLVFYVPKDSTREFVLYDFTVQPGDTLRNIWIENYWTAEQETFYEQVLTMYDTSSILVNGVRRRIVNTWIEGIGNPQGIFWDTYVNVSWFSITLRCHGVNNNIIYPFNGIADCGKTSSRESGIVGISLKAYPNPVQDRLILEVSDDYNFRIPEIRILVVDLAGKAHECPHKVLDKSIEIDFSNLSPGLYEVKVTDGKVEGTTKVLRDY